MVSHRRFRFSTRTLLFVMSGAALIVALFMIPIQQHNAEQRYVSELRKNYPNLIANPVPVGPKWLRNTMTQTTGLPYWMNRTGSIDVSGDTMRIGNLPPSKIDFGDDDLIEMQSSLPYLQNLCVTRTNVSDRSIPTLLEFEKLKRIYLHESRMTNDGIEELRNQRRFVVYPN